MPDTHILNSEIAATPAPQTQSAPQIRPKKLKSLLAFIENAVKGDNYLFRNLYVEIDGKETDILENGQLSCAVFVSWLLLPLGLIKEGHATVSGTVKDLLANGWLEVSSPKPGAVLVWERITFENGESHTHIGFCLNEREAISNSTNDTFPRKHSIDYDSKRKIEKILWHPSLDQG